MNVNKILLGTAIVMFALSFFSYRQSVTRAERFERGQKFLSQLNPDNIHEIQISKGEDEVVLKKGKDNFVVASQHNYPAKNETINRFLNDVITIGLEKEVGTGSDLEKELAVVSDAEEATEVVLKNDSGKEMVRFFVGKAAPDGGGNYLKRVDGDDPKIYLSSKGVYLTTSGSSFLDKEIVDVKSDQVVRIEGPDFVIEAEEEGGSLKLKDVPSGKKEGSDVSQVKNLLAGLQFDSVYLADDPEVSSLQFKKAMTVSLSDHSGYEVQVATKDEKTFIRIEGTIDMAKYEASRQVGRDDSEEQLKEKSDVLTRGDEINEFNSFHGSWVYALSDFVGKKFTKSKSDLLEDEEEDEAEG